MTAHICTACKSQFDPVGKPIVASIMLVIGLPLLILGAVGMVDGAGIGAAAIVTLGGIISVRGAQYFKPRAACPACKSIATIPLDTPAGREMAGKRVKG